MKRFSAGFRRLLLGLKAGVFLSKKHLGSSYNQQKFRSLGNQEDFDLTNMLAAVPVHDSQNAPAARPVLTVWYGSMPESNGKTNWTAILHRKDQGVFDGMTIARSEYPDRVRYEADCMRHLIGEIDEEPCILEYNADLMTPKRTC